MPTNTFHQQICKHHFKRLKVKVLVAHQATNMSMLLTNVHGILQAGILK